MKSEIALLWIIFDLISSKLLMDLTLIIRKLSFTRISGPHEPIIDLSENRLVQSPAGVVNQLYSYDRPVIWKVIFLFYLII